ncbi:uncharacterized protein N7479_009348 [Penicillium vulpinum]|uniref:uncharacterized protein n=1 Tax=Penicillium vulpinum TaxID=29845 RepID=UPI00254697B0|nr:uncharacterized protein N7479_009348 [Penicillium vulpinum]KAJ5950935.1 hypothetical protein N7479_009348 [Penicillium vulpinum]
MAFSKFRRILTCGCYKDSESETDSKTPPTGSGISDEDEPFSGLSEVAAPVPVERTTEEEEARHESLDSNISRSHSHPHLSNN